jgi:hypothetical protein
MRRTRKGSIDHSCLSRPNSRSTEPRWWYSVLDRAVVRRTSGWRRSALTHSEAGWHSPVGQAPLRAAVLGVGPGERPDAVLALARQVLACLDVRRLAQRDHRADAVSLAKVGDQPVPGERLSHLDGDGARRLTPDLAYRADEPRPIRFDPDEIRRWLEDNAHGPRQGEHGTDGNPK